MSGKVRLDDDKIGQLGIKRRPNHQIWAVGWLQSEIPSIGDRGSPMIGYELKGIWEMSAKL